MITEGSRATRIIVGISGATGIAYGVETLRQLSAAGVETHLVLSKSAKRTIGEEGPISRTEIEELATGVHHHEDMGASIASGSFRADGMIVAPCTVKSLAEIANGISSNLIARAADVTLKERRRLVLMVRETPLTAIHLNNMLTVTNCGGIIAPPCPAFYAMPDSLEEVTTFSVARVLDLFGIHSASIPRWKEALAV